MIHILVPADLLIAQVVLLPRSSYRFGRISQLMLVASSINGARRSSKSSRWFATSNLAHQNFSKSDSKQRPKNDGRRKPGARISHLHDREIERATNCLHQHLALSLSQCSANGLNETMAEHQVSCLLLCKFCQRFCLHTNALLLRSSKTESEQS